MAKESLEQRLDKIFSPSDVGAGDERVKARLSKICDEIQDRLGKDAKRAIIVSLQPGFQANMGQQLNVVVEIPDRRYQDTLFRAYVPLGGLPVHLDFYGEEPTKAETLEETEEAILGFLGKPEVKSRLNDYRSLVRK